jgi:hypothetical protein
MRRFIPRKTDLATLSNRRFRSLIAAYLPAFAGTTRGGVLPSG